MIEKKIFIALVMLGCLCGMAAEKSVIAIFDFYDVKGKEISLGEKYSLLLFARLSLNDDIKMVERKELNKIIAERNLNRSGLVKNNYMEVAALVNADYIITGRIFDAEGSRIINLKLTRCSDGKIYGKSYFTDSQKKDYLEKAAAQAAEFIAKSLKK